MAKHLLLILAADHRGFALKNIIKDTFTLPNYTITWIDVGAFDDQRSDYPLFAHAAIERMQEHQTAQSIMLCGTGVGMAIAANRYKGMYAALVWNAEIARLAKEDDNANILVLPADFITKEETISILKSWVEAEFKDGRYGKRLQMIDGLI